MKKRHLILPLAVLACGLGLVVAGSHSSRGARLYSDQQSYGAVRVKAPDAIRDYPDPNTWFVPDPFAWAPPLRAELKPFKQTRQKVEGPPLTIHPFLTNPYREPGIVMAGSNMATR
ncbi:MAG TPA: hypothetical protein VGL56_09910 [Fimbriimonadaceae bacterium]|jgi:hypothetical protein